MDQDAPQQQSSGSGAQIDGEINRKLDSRYNGAQHNSKSSTGGHFGYNGAPAASAYGIAVQCTDNRSSPGANFGYNLSFGSCAFRTSASKVILKL